MSTTDKVKLPEPVAYRIRYRSEPGMIGHYPWSYSERVPYRSAVNPAYEVEGLCSEAQMLAMHEQGRLAGLEEAARAVADTPREEWVDGSDQWGNPCPARVYTTRAQYVAAIRSLAAASIGAKLGEE